MADDTASTPKRPDGSGMKLLGVAVSVALVALAAWRFRPRPTAPTAPQRRAAPAAIDASVTVDAPAPDVSAPDASAPPEADPLEFALFAPLRPGAPLGDGRIVSIGRVDNGRIRVEVDRNGTRVLLGVALAGPGAERLIRAGRYVVTIEGDRGFEAAIPLVPRLAAALSLNQDAPVPAGLRPLDTSPPRRDAGAD